ncbi:MAG TPA: hypothetical protein GXZ52_08100 [Clostridiales bacterium]|nr:hypothetical protein [Clostridiales bacterium]
MSASQEKKKRKQLREEGLDKRKIAEQERLAQQKRYKRTISIIIAVVAVLLIAVILLNSNLFYTVLPAVSIGGESYTTAEFNYMYFTNYYNFIQSYGDIFDTSKPLSKQPFSADMTWEDYFKQSTIDSLREMTMLCQRAEEAGFTLSQEEKDEIEINLHNLQNIYTLYGYPSLKQYLAAVYGRGCTLETVEKMMTKSYIANGYSKQVYDSLAYTDEELESHYQEKRDEYDSINYRYYYVNGSADKEAGIDEETVMANAKEKAELIAAGSVGDEEAFASLVYEHANEDEKEDYKDRDSTLMSARGGYLSAEYSEWLLSDERVYGETTVIEGGAGYHVLMFISREDNHYNLAQVRHILIKAEADENGEYSDEAKAEARKKAEEILAQWKDGEATEESFAELAKEHSQDTASSENGGLYDSVNKGQMVEEFDAFCFEEGRKPGDTAIVYGESSVYAGYHIMYYVGEGRLYSDYLAENALRSNDYNEWKNAQMESYVADTKFALTFAM